MRSIERFYGTSYYWHKWVGKFLRSINQLSVNHIPEAIYLDNEFHKPLKGYYGAILRAVLLGFDNKQLSINDLKKWHAMITSETQAYFPKSKEEDEMMTAKEEEQKEMLKMLAEHLPVLAKTSLESHYIAFIGDLIIELESKKLFNSENRKMIHLIVSYVAAFFGKPLFVFKNKKQYDEALASNLKMRLLLAELSRDAILFNGYFLEKVSGEFDTDLYQRPGAKKVELAIHWDELVKESKNWKAA